MHEDSFARISEVAAHLLAVHIVKKPRYCGKIRNYLAPFIEHLTNSADAKTAHPVQCNLWFISSTVLHFVERLED